MTRRGTICCPVVVGRERCLRELVAWVGWSERVGGGRTTLMWLACPEGHYSSATLPVPAGMVNPAPAL